MRRLSCRLLVLAACAARAHESCCSESWGDDDAEPPYDAAHDADDGGCGVDAAAEEPQALLIDLMSFDDIPDEAKAELWNSSQSENLARVLLVDEFKKGNFGLEGLDEEKRAILDEEAPVGGTVYSEILERLAAEIAAAPDAYDLPLHRAIVAAARPPQPALWTRAAETSRTFWKRSSKVRARIVGGVKEAAPWVAAGAVAAAALEASGAGGFLATRLKSSGAGVVFAALVGLASPLCSCGSLPTAAALAADGVPLGPVVAFLTAAQSSGLDSAAITYGLLGPRAALGRLLGALVLACAAGSAVPATKKTSKPRRTRKTASSPTAFPKAVVAVVAEVFPSVVLGVVASSLARDFVPRPSSSGLLGDAALRAATLGATVPLQLCEHATVSLAAGFQRAGASAGLAFAFLLAAPAVNASSLLVLLRRPAVARPGVAAARVVSALTGAALALSYAVDSLGLDLLVVDEADSGASPGLKIPAWVLQRTDALVGLLAAATAGQAIANRRKPDCCDGAHED